MNFAAIWGTLQTTPLCAGLTSAQAEQVFESAAEKTLPPGAMLFEEWQVSRQLFVVLKGRLEVFKQGADQTELLLAEVGPGAALGEMSLLGGNMGRSASARAVDEVKVLELPADRFTALLGMSHVGALKVVHNLAQLLSRRLFAMDEKLVEAMDAVKKKDGLDHLEKALGRWSF